MNEQNPQQQQNQTNQPAGAAGIGRPPFNSPNASSDTAQPTHKIENPYVEPVDQKLLHLFEHDPDEQLVAQINKHKIGLFFIWVTTITIFVVTAVAAYAVLRFAPDIGLEGSLFRLITTIGFSILGFLILVGGYVSAWVYKRSVLVITSEKLVQLLQRNIFDRKISQLSIGDVQDVTVWQQGLLSRLFHYGTIVIETAGEQVNYTFTYVPHPHEYSKEIVGAHERNLKLYGN